MLSVTFLLQGTWALAGTTGNIAGYVKDSNGVPVAGVQVQAVSPSQSQSTTTDSGGHFILQSLAPDTYTLTLTKTGYAAASIPGAVVFADQTQEYNLSLSKQLVTISNQTAKAGNSGLVKSGVGGDLYNVNSQTASTAAQLGGGGSLDSVYSAIASVPGLVVGTGGAGWNQATVIRGQNPWTTGFEFDGVPVNRSFDNYSASTGSNLGLSELQVYTGGGPGSTSSSGISGFINQVIKTGTYPGYGTLYGSLGGPTYYHSARVEAGGATPDRNFSYYVGLSGYNQTFNYIDNQNGASYETTGQPYQGTACLLFCDSPVGPGIMSICGPKAPAVAGTDGCYSSFYTFLNAASMITDRENVVNFHIGVPRKNGLKDDIQLLWSASALKTYWSNSVNQSGPGINSWTYNMTGLPYCNNTYGCGANPYNVPHYDDAITYNLPFGTNVAPGGKALPYQWYLQPSSPTDRSPLAALPTNEQDLSNNDTGIVKLQYTHPLSSQAFIRFYGYTFFSDWTLDGPVGAFSYDLGFSPASPNYNLITHTLGGSLQFADQINDKNLINVTGNYSYAGTSRFNNTGFVTPSYYPLLGCTLQNQAANGCVATSKVGLISEKGGQFTCYDPASGAAEACLPGGSWESNPYALNQTGGTTIGGGAKSAAALNGAYWAQVWNGNASGTYNTVTPQFWNISAADEFRPNDKWLINFSLRYDDYDYGLAQTNTQANQFWGQIIQKDLCYSPTLGVETNPLGPGVFPPPNPVYGACGPGYTPGAPFNVSSPSNYNLTYWSPRYSATYTQSPDTVWRFSGGRYAEAPLTAAVQYANASGNATSLWANFFGNGFTSPFHAIPGETSAQYDLSLERHVRGSDLSFKITPFYGLTSNWEQQSFIGAGFVTQIPVGKYQNYGVEAAITKGDFSRNGFSGQLAFTYTQAQTQYQAGIVPNQVSTLNTLIQNYNCMTKAGYASQAKACTALGLAAPSQCYEAGKASSCSAPPICEAAGVVVACGTAGATVAYTPVLNAYYGDAPQGLQNTNGWYPGTLYQLQPSLGPGAGVYAQGYASPYVTSLILNYRHDKFAITPTFQVESGTHYGSAMDVVGIDPRVCSLNQGFTGSATTNNALDCDYRTLAGPGAAAKFGYFYIPNPASGSFSTIGQYVEPNISIMNMQLSYDVSPKIKLQATLTNIFHVCWGGSTGPWSSLYGPGGVNCGYNTNGLYVGTTSGKGWFNGSSPYDSKANGQAAYAWQTTPYAPSTGNGIGSYFPFNAYFSAQIKL